MFTLGERYWLKVWGKGKWSALKLAQGRADRTAYTVKLDSLYTFVSPSTAAAYGSQYHGGLHQHVLHHAPLAAISNGTTLTTMVQDPLEKYLPSAQSRPGFYLGIYAAIVLLDAFFSVATSAVGYWGQYRAANTLHDRLLDVVLRGTIRFFTVTPVGRILNRFSRGMPRLCAATSTDGRH